MEAEAVIGRIRLTPLVTDFLRMLIGLSLIPSIDYVCPAARTGNFYQVIHTIFFFSKDYTATGLKCAFYNHTLILNFNLAPMHLIVPP